MPQTNISLKEETMGDLANPSGKEGSTIIYW